MQRSDDIRQQREDTSLEFPNGALRATNFAHSPVIMRTTTQSNNNNNTNLLTSATASTITSPAGTNKLNGNFNNQIVWPPTLAAAAVSGGSSHAITTGTALTSTPGDSHSSCGVPTPPLLSDPSPDRSTSTYTSSGRFPSNTKNGGGFRVTKKMALLVCGLITVSMVMLLSCQFHSRNVGFILHNDDRSSSSEGKHHHSEEDKSKLSPRTYPHPRWRPKGAFVSAKAVYESDRVSVEEHSVRLSDTAAYASDAESGADKANVVHNWIWVNQPDQINVLVYLGDGKELATSLLNSKKVGGGEASKDPLASYSALSNVPVLSSIAASNNNDFPTLTQWLNKNKEESNERLFLMFRQRKYGYEGHSLAVVGGAVDLADRGSPVAAAQRELLEELGITDCPTMNLTPPNNTNNAGGRGENNIIDNMKRRRGIIQLGGYRSDTNRGGGVVYSFVASRCPLGPNATFVAVPNSKGTTDNTHKRAKMGIEKKRIMKGDAVPPKVVMQSADGDLESQGVVIVTQQYLMEGMINNNNDAEVGGMQGVVKEVKWAATVAMAILRLTGLSI